VPDDALPFSTLSPGVLDDLARAVAVASAALDLLAGERQRLRALSEHWAGGHRLRFDDQLRALDRRHADVVTSLDTARLALRRAAGEASR
jgi:hypothetical protein